MRNYNRREFLGTSAAGLAAIGVAGPPPQEAPGVVVHEWGVITVANGSRIVNLRSAGAKRVAAGGELPAGLPAFAETWEAAFRGVVDEWRRQPVDKPIVYFYSKERRELSFKVSVPTGRPRAWWPPTKDFGPRPKLPNLGKRGLRRMGEDEEEDPKPESVKGDGGHLHWSKLVLDPGATDFRPADGWWSVARKTDSTPVRAGKDAEKFLFYDAFAKYDQEFKVRWLKTDLVRIENPGPLAQRHLVALRVRDGKCDSATHRLLKPGESVVLELKPGRPAGLADSLVEAGLYRAEAGGLVAAWEDEFFGIDGHRVLAVLPRETYDALLPAEISPAPAAFERVLVAQVECLGPERRAEVLELIERLGAETPDTRQSAAAELRRLGALAEETLREALRTAADPEVAAQLQALLEG